VFDLYFQDEISFCGFIKQYTQGTCQQNSFFDYESVNTYVAAHMSDDVSWISLCDIFEQSKQFLSHKKEDVLTKIPLIYSGTKTQVILI